MFGLASVVGEYGCDFCSQLFPSGEAWEGHRTVGLRLENLRSFGIRALVFRDLVLGIVEMKVY